MKNNSELPQADIKAIVGLGNPGPTYVYTRHNIGFRVLDALADTHQATWQKKDNFEVTSIMLHDKKVILLKPLTFMNDSGRVISYLHKQGIKQEHILVVHDELELPFGTLKIKFDGSAKGHNGLKSIIAHGGPGFFRLRFGIDRPTNREEVPNYVLAKFKEPAHTIEEKINEAVQMIEQFI